MPKELPKEACHTAILSIATGKSVYVDLAVNLARSFKVWHKESPIKFVLVTDQKHLLPSDLDDISVIEIGFGEYGHGFSTKLHLDELTPAEKTLFVDADCLCTGPLEPVFERFNNHSVSVVGKNISNGEWFGDVSTILSQFSLSEMPRFNGGLYYIEKGETATKVYETARALENKYDSIGFKRLRGRANDEVLMSLAMAIHDQKPVLEDGTIMNSTLACPGGINVDVTTGYVKLQNPKTHALYNSWYPEEMSPVLVHFLSSETENLPYVSEAEKLRLIMSNKYPIALAKLQSYLNTVLPITVFENMKYIFRPMYRKFFGVRAIKASR